ncbi:hypothetical protein DI43_03600 [Geobacillus sp. CAMR12739]|nr:hypothetical protein DI43_03600 [Geobacillus sp. CAMR12739]
MGLRENNDSENEFSVVGPKVGFVENVGVNLHLIRRQVVTPNLVFREMSIGSVSKTKVVIAYIDGVANPDIIQTVTQRLESIHFDVVFDNAILDQLLADNSRTPFPRFYLDRADRPGHLCACVGAGGQFFATAPRMP